MKAFLLPAVAQWFNGSIAQLFNDAMAYLLIALMPY